MRENTCKQASTAPDTLHFTRARPAPHPSLHPSHSLRNATANTVNMWWCPAALTSPCDNSKIAQCLHWEQSPIQYRSHLHQKVMHRKSHVIGDAYTVLFYCILFCQVHFSQHKYCPLTWNSQFGIADKCATQYLQDPFD